MDKTNVSRPIPLKLLFAIVDRGRGEEVLRIARAENAQKSVTLLGRGTATSDILDMLGIGETQKDVCICVVEASRAGKALSRLDELLKLSIPGGGIAFTIPVSSIAGMRAFRELYCIKGENANE